MMGENRRPIFPMCESLVHDKMFTAFATRDAMKARDLNYLGKTDFHLTATTFRYFASGWPVVE